MPLPQIIYLGIKGSVIALDANTGEQLWATKLKGDDFVNVALQGANLLATTRGEIFCLHPQDGAIRWHNPLRGYGWGLISMTGEGITPNPVLTAAEKRQREAQASSAGSANAGA